MPNVVQNGEITWVIAKYGELVMTNILELIQSSFNNVKMIIYCDIIA
jgi:hypothetical protein